MPNSSISQLYASAIKRQTLHGDRLTADKLTETAVIQTLARLSTRSSPAHHQPPDVRVGSPPAANARPRVRMERSEVWRQYYESSEAAQRSPGPCDARPERK